MRTCLPFSLVTAFLLVACTVDFEQYRPGQGAGGNPAGGAGAGGAGGTGGAAGGGGTGGTGGGPACELPADCPAGACEFPTCTEGVCGVTQKAEGDACPAGLCTAGGMCVECLENIHCTTEELCVDNQCASLECLNMVLDPGETDVDCGGPTCPKCDVGENCLGPADCLTEFCANNGNCEECGGDSDCAATSFCDDATGGCIADLLPGAACDDDDQCPNGFCENNFCCDSACGGTCESCAAAQTGGTNGICSPTMAATDPDGDCNGNGCAADTCHGAMAACGFDPMGTACGTDACASALLTESECNAAGSCVAQAAMPCPGNFVCNNSTSCETTCSDNNDCVAAFHCVGGACIADKANGMPCVGGDDEECLSGFCVAMNGDNVCCNVACENSCEACDLPGFVGTCTEITAGDPDNECPNPPDNGDNCAAGNSCN